MLLFWLLGHTSNFSNRTNIKERGLLLLSATWWKARKSSGAPERQKGAQAKAKSRNLSQEWALKPERQKGAQAKQAKAKSLNLSNHKMGTQTSLHAEFHKTSQPQQNKGLKLVWRFTKPLGSKEVFASGMSDTKLKTRLTEMNRCLPNRY